MTTQITSRTPHLPAGRLLTTSMPEPQTAKPVRPTSIQPALAQGLGGVLCAPPTLASPDDFELPSPVAAPVLSAIQRMCDMPEDVLDIARNFDQRYGPTPIRAGKGPAATSRPERGMRVPIPPLGVLDMHARNIEAMQLSDPALGSGRYALEFARAYEAIKAARDAVVELRGSDDGDAQVALRRSVRHAVEQISGSLRSLAMALTMRPAESLRERLRAFEPMDEVVFEDFEDAIKCAMKPHDVDRILDDLADEAEKLADDSSEDAREEFDEKARHTMQKTCTEIISRIKRKLDGRD